jgi:hypothetical protein
MVGFEYGVFYKLIGASVLNSFTFGTQTTKEINADVNSDTFIVFGF